MWQSVASIDFRETRVTKSANIVIGAQGEPEGWAFSNVSYDAGSPEAAKPITQSLICLNPLKPWKVGFDGNLKIYDLRYTIAHEVGHAIGLDHPEDDNQIMGFRYQEHFRDLQPGDIAGATLLYGARQPETIAAVNYPGRLIQQAARGAKHWGGRAFIGRAPPMKGRVQNAWVRKFVGPRPRER
jgi:hypothetical protein